MDLSHSISKVSPTAHLVDQNLLVIRETKLQLLAWITKVYLYILSKK